MTAAFGNWTRRFRFVGTPGTLSTTKYAGAVNFVASGTQIGSTSGFVDFVAAWPTWQGTVWGSGVTADDERGDYPGDNQFASLIIRDVSQWQNPGLLVRATAASGDGFSISPYLHLGTYEVADWTAGGYTLLGTGGSVVDVAGDVLMATALDVPGGSDAIGAWLNGAPQFSTSSTLHASGSCGMVGTATVGNAAEDLRFGNLATLDGLEIEETAGFPISMSAGVLAGVFESDVLEGPGNACDWFSVLVEVHEEEVGHLVGDATYEVGSGEARKRGAYTREASEAKPGGDFDWLVSDADQLVGDPAYRVCGRLGGHGRNTRAKVSTRFRVSGVWSDYVPGAWVGPRAADAIQCKVELDRVSEAYQIRITRVLLAVAA